MKRVQNTAHTNQLWNKNDFITIGVSGGPDSMALLAFLNELKVSYNFSLFVAHVNYGLRGKESNLDEQLVRSFCTLHNLPFFLHKPKSIKKDENSLRKERFLFFEKVKAQTHSQAIALAHHKNDQAETVFFRFMRGGGRKGLSGMRVKNGSYIRPFLFIEKQDILSFVKENNIPYRIDASNLQCDFTRNRIRNRILPFLEKEMHPHIISILSQTGEIFSQEDAFLNNELRNHFQFTKKSSNEVSFSLSHWSSLHRALQRRALLLCIDTLSENVTSAQDISYSRIEEIRNMLENAKPKHQKKVFLGLILERKGDKVTLFSGKNVSS